MSMKYKQYYKKCRLQFQLAWTWMLCIFLLGVIPATVYAQARNNAAPSVPCNTTLANIVKVPLDPILGSVVGLKTLFVGLIAVGVIVGALFHTTKFGKNCLKYSGILAIVGIFIGAISAFAKQYVSSSC